VITEEPGLVVKIIEMGDPPKIKPGVFQEQSKNQQKQWKDCHYK